MERKEPISKIANIISQVSKNKEKAEKLKAELEKKQELTKKLKAHDKDIKWLTEDVENIEYYCNYDKELEDQIERINKYTNQMKHYFEKNPEEQEKMVKAVEELFGFTRYIRAMTDGSELELSLLQDENAFSKLSEEQKDVLRQANAYREACAFMEQQAKNPNSYLCDNLFIKAHYIMESGTSEDIQTIRKLRFRDGSDNLIIELRGFFNPLEGEKVSSRMLQLFSEADFVWKMNPIEKAVRFATEYIRIQPHMDGNKRIALLGMNYILMKNGYMPIYFEYGEFSPMCKQYEKIDGFKVVKQQGLAEDIKEGILYRDLTSMMKTVCNKLESRVVKYMKRIGNNELVEQMNKLKENDRKTDNEI